MDTAPQVTLPRGARHGWPLVVQVGYLGDATGLPRAALADALVARLGRLGAELRLGEGHFLCGISSLASPGDHAFGDACRRLGWPHRIFLHARAEPEGEHIIQVRVVGEAHDAARCAEECALEILRVCDVLVVLSAGEGNAQLLARARQRGRSLLVLCAEQRDDGSVELREEERALAGFAPPGVPAEVEGEPPLLGAGLPTARAYGLHLVKAGDRQARGAQFIFAWAALLVIGAHVGATACAVVALKVAAPALTILLATELVLLGGGLWVHRRVHHSRAVQRWSLARLLAEVGRSVSALEGVPGYLSHLFALPFPDSIRPLTRTLRVLHLRDTFRLEPGAWQARRDAYVRERVSAEGGGQLRYYAKAGARAARRWRLAQAVFLASAGLAIAATVLKLGLGLAAGHGGAPPHGGWFGALGTLAVLLPVLAVAALSLAASFDVEARMRTYSEMVEYLRRQERHLLVATSEREFAALAFETESRLLGETATWFTRRFFAPIT